MSKVVFQEELGGSTTIQAQDTADTFTLQLPAADGTLVHSDAGGTATFDNLSLTGAVIAGAWDADTIDVEHGGTGATTLTGYVIASGTSPMTASATIPSTNITGLGTMSVQNANAVAIDGGTADDLALGAVTPAAATVTALRVNSTVSLAGNTGSLGQVLTSNGGSAPTWENVAGTGDVIGPASATDNALVRFDDTTGKLIQNSVVLIGDTGSITGVNALTAESLTVNNNTILDSLTAESLTVNNNTILDSLTAESLTVNNNAVLGSSNTDTLDVNARITTDLEPNANNAKDIGTSGRNWRDGFFGRTLQTVNFSASGTASFTSTGAVKLPVGTEAQRPTPAAGMLRFNDDTDEFEGYNGTAWSSVGGSAITNDTSTATDVFPLFADATSGTASNVYTSAANLLYVPSKGEFKSEVLVAMNGIVVNSATVTANYTIPTGSNAMSAGPITVDGGVTVTVSAGSVWTVV